MQQHNMKCSNERGHSFGTQRLWPNTRKCCPKPHYRVENWLFLFSKRTEAESGMWNLKKTRTKMEVWRRRGNRNPQHRLGARQTHTPLVQHWCNRTDRSQGQGTKITPGSQTPDSHHSFDTYCTMWTSFLWQKFTSKQLQFTFNPSMIYSYYRILTEVYPTFHSEHIKGELLGDTK